MAKYNYIALTKTKLICLYVRCISIYNRNIYVIVTVKFYKFLSDKEVALSAESITKIIIRMKKWLIILLSRPIVILLLICYIGVYYIFLPIANIIHSIFISEMNETSVLDAF